MKLTVIFLGEAPFIWTYTNNINVDDMQLTRTLYRHLLTINPRRTCAIGPIRRLQSRGGWKEVCITCAWIRIFAESVVFLSCQQYLITGLEMSNTGSKRPRGSPMGEALIQVHKGIIQQRQRRSISLISCLFTRRCN